MMKYIIAIITAMARPKGIKTKQLTTEQRQRIRTLYFDAKLSPAEIKTKIAYIRNQIKIVIRANIITLCYRSERYKIISQEEKAMLIIFILLLLKNRKIL